MSEARTFTTWKCDQCGAEATLPGVHEALPDKAPWTQITLDTGYGTTGYWGSGSRVYQDPRPECRAQRVRLVCSLGCAQAMLAERWKFTWGSRA